ncbi:DUF3105 domain-containing protein [Nocardioides caeni]|uniref:DUF3105 domain-containing protein n=1 Tax=Nocardioides caeni TaxID=574700 RepID=A0A4S8NLJ2_9ACTN|nr:DUF3105 domain-containing protein [Nocardioides caeni]THV17867.1 DUF3105 domain-containing protein [Nocardioides caeni]
MAKTSKSDKSDRQKVIDDIRRKQKGAEKRQGLAIVGVCVVVALGIIGIAAWGPITTAIQKARWAGTDLEDIGAGADVCGEVTEKDATGTGEHVPFEQQVTYPDSPPAFGPHWNEANIAPAPINDRFYTKDSRPELESLVHNIEHGYTILWYDETIADSSSELGAIKAIAASLDANDTNQRLKFKAVPWTEEDAKESAEAAAAEAETPEAAPEGEEPTEPVPPKEFPEGQHIAFTHWRLDSATQTQYGVWQYCSKTSGAALKQFMTDYPFTDSPEPFIY